MESLGRMRAGNGQVHSTGTRTVARSGRIVPFLTRLVGRGAPGANGARRPAPVARAAPRGGGGGGGSDLLERGSITSPGKSADKARMKTPIYKVLLHNDNVNRREYVVKVLVKVVENLAMEHAMSVMQEAHESGVALVLACPQGQAEAYVEDLRLNGLVSTMEPGQ
ncbi:MAG: ATP-dependent Clp protease adaptor protein ClpS-domain-containing protein [Monoraphidium minutum]|nr:MAG: ATP-dependent Clp protease adaptor protein ClpS-domain-containing protein [Monoraphidium minutum]